MELAFGKVQNMQKAPASDALPNLKTISATGHYLVILITWKTTCVSSNHFESFFFVEDNFSICA